MVAAFRAFVNRAADRCAAPRRFLLRPTSPGCCPSLPQECSKSPSDLNGRQRENLVGRAILSQPHTGKRGLPIEGPDNAKPDVRVPRPGTLLVAVRRTQVRWGVVPRAAPQDSLRAVTRRPDAAIGRRSVV